MSKQQIIKQKLAKSKEIIEKNYTDEETDLIINFVEKYTKRGLPEYERGEGISLKLKDNDDLLALARLAAGFGTADPELQSFLLNQVIATFRGYSSSECINYDAVASFSNNAVAILQGIAPKDEVESLLAVQMIGVHNLAMDMMKRAMITDQTLEGAQANVNAATKMLRTFTAQMDALKKYRTGGQQKVTVEHVHVNEGGQAIVGNVNQGGGGDKRKNCG